MKDGNTFIREETLKIVSLSVRKVTPTGLEKIICDKFALEKSSAKQIVRNLVDTEELVYTNLFGRSFLERSFNRPVKISPRIILCPPHRCTTAEPGEVIVKIMPGASFGSGEHATTRLCLKAMDHALENAGSPVGSCNTLCLDIGTGSGVQVIAAMGLGLGKGIGIDLDPNALSEAKQNVLLNDMSSKIMIENIPVSSLTDSFYLIIANLRYPTLVELSPQISRLSEKNGLVVLSGFRPNESDWISACYEKAGFEITEHGEENNWASVVLKNKG